MAITNYFKRIQSKFSWLHCWIICCRLKLIRKGPYIPVQCHHDHDDLVFVFRPCFHRHPEFCALPCTSTSISSKEHLWITVMDIRAVRVMDRPTVWLFRYNKNVLGSKYDLSSSTGLDSTIASLLSFELQLHCSYIIRWTSLLVCSLLHVMLLSDDIFI